MRKADKVMFKDCTSAMRKIITKSYRIQRMAHAESDKNPKGGKK